jgi:hydroperoxide lyase
LLGPISDRLDYFWFQGPETFFKKRTDKYKSTVFRTNVPPCFPLFLGVNPNVVAVLDCKSFAHLFDMDLVEKKNCLVGDFMPSVKFTGDLRTCAYLDTSEPQHAQVHTNF